MSPKYQADQLNQLIQEHNIHFERQVPLENWPDQHRHTVREVLNIAKVTFDEYGTETKWKGQVKSVPSKFKSELKRRAEELSQVSDQQYKLGANESTLRTAIEPEVFLHLDNLVYCKKCGHPRWVSEFHAAIPEPDSAKGLQKRCEKKKICHGGCEGKLKGSPEMLFYGMNEKKIFLDLGDAAFHEKTAKKPDRVYSLVHNESLQKVLPKGGLSHSPFRPPELSFPFLVIEAKCAAANMDFLYAENQTAFPIRALLDLQKNLQESSGCAIGANDGPLVWFMAYKGDQWRVYGSIIDNAKYRSIILWQGTIRSENNALQLLLIIDYISDWATHTYRPAILRYLQQFALLNKNVAVDYSPHSISEALGKVSFHTPTGVVAKLGASESRDQDITVTFSKEDRYNKPRRTSKRYQALEERNVSDNGDRGSTRISSPTDGENESDSAGEQISGESWEERDASDNGDQDDTETSLNGDGDSASDPASERSSIGTPTGVALLSASRDGKASLVKRMLCKNHTIDDQYLSRALRFASDGGYEAVVEVLLKCGALIDADIDARETALHAASQQGHQAIVELLLCAGIDINIRDRYGCTALHSASRGGHNAIVKQLLCHEEVDINAKDKDGQTALYEASYRGQNKVVRLLLIDGANVKARDIEKNTALHAASANGMKEWYSSFLVMALRETALQFASGNGHEGVVHILLDDDAHLDPQDCSGRTALYDASRKGHSAVVEALLDKGANADLNCGSLEEAALAAASRNGYKAVVELLLAKDVDVDVDAKDKEGKTAIQRALNHGHPAIAQLLFRHGANLHPGGRRLNDALQQAKSQNHDGIVRLLLKRRADFEKKEQKAGKKHAK
ncbi:MAG: hypothetical protein M1819_005859 [Sarea resinae]|nr:MAG: hypothetical protein M1819_005859 [Sarea resinae]